MGPRERKDGGATMHGTSRPCLRGTVERATHECCRVGRANNSNVFGQFFEQESQRYLTFTMIRTPSSYGRARGVESLGFQNPPILLVFGNGKPWTKKSWICYVGYVFFFINFILSSQNIDIYIYNLYIMSLSLSLYIIYIICTLCSGPIMGNPSG